MTEAEKLVDVHWVYPDNPQEGVECLGYIDGILFGVNYHLIGSLVWVKDVDGVLERKYNDTRRRRLSDESDPKNRSLGIRMRPWRTGPWLLTWISASGETVGLTLDMKAEVEDVDLMTAVSTIDVQAL